MSPEILTMAKEALNMFAFLATELIILFLAISYLVGVLQEFITPQKIQSILSSRNGKGYIIAALLGSITPFCSCSTIPFLKGLLRARAGFGPMMVFLFSSPLLNPVIIGLFVITFGFKVALFYFLIAIIVAVTAGFVLEKLGFERYVKPEAYEAVKSDKPCSSAKKETATSSCSGDSDDNKNSDIDNNNNNNNNNKAVQNNACASAATNTVTKNTQKNSSCAVDAAVISACGSNVKPKKEDNRWLRIWLSTWKDFKQVFPYLLIGISLGAFIYGFMPTDLIAEYAGEGHWYAIPIAAVIGIPLYIRAEAVIPLSAALVAKGMALGSVMALIIGSAGASLTEVILLKSIFKNQMIIAFLTVILGMAMAAGYLYSFLF